MCAAAVRNLQPSLAAVWINDSLGLKQPAHSNSDHLRATMRWLARAHDASGRKGVSGGYSVIDGWLAPYPETTGYIIPTFFDYAAFSGQGEWRERALAMADWEVEVQMPIGAVQAGLYKGPSAPQVPAVFNTGQVILGWCRAFLETRRESYISAAVRAGEWLVSVQSSDGSWHFESQETETDVHAYDVRTAWSLLEIFEITKDQKYHDAAIRNLDWTLRQQRESGWFANNALFESQDKWTRPFTHTIAYVMEGFQESFRILRDQVYFTAYLKTAEKLLEIYGRKKFLAGDFDDNWNSASRYTCLTGNAQIACVWLKHFEFSGDDRFLRAALQLTSETKSSQFIAASHGGVRGGIKGSAPLNGKYTPYIFPNWAAKFFVDSLLLEERVAGSSGYEGTLQTRFT